MLPSRRQEERRKAVTASVRREGQLRRKRTILIATAGFTAALAFLLVLVVAVNLVMEERKDYLLVGSLLTGIIALLGVLVRVENQLTEAENGRITESRING